MQAFIIALGVLTGLISEGNSLQCQQCRGTGSCSGSAMACSADATQCITGIQNNTQAKTGAQLTAFKNCLDSSSRNVCSKDFSFRNSQLQYQIFAKCCSKDGCNSENVKEIGPVDNTPNGYKCGECASSQTSNECTSTQEVQCTGTHFHCGSFNGTGGQAGEPVTLYSFKGCISLDICNAGVPAFLGSSLTNYDIKCTPAIKV